MTYEYHCTTCNVLTEKILVKEKDREEEIPCLHCSGVAHLIISGPAVLTQGMSKQPIDVAIGKDSAMRWDRINTNQANRDKVRKESGVAGISTAGVDAYKPITTEQTALRARAIKASQVPVK